MNDELLRRIETVRKHRRFVRTMQGRITSITNGMYRDIEVQLIEHIDTKLETLSNDELKSYIKLLI